jgi:hypothetical protein
MMVSVLLLLLLEQFAVRLQNPDHKSSQQFIESSITTFLRKTRYRDARGQLVSFEGRGAWESKIKMATILQKIKEINK